MGLFQRVVEAYDNGFRRRKLEAARTQTGILALRAEILSGQPRSLIRDEQERYERQLAQLPEPRTRVERMAYMMGYTL